jgi:RimJ/RimL family protein N-acetyltransferase
MINFVFKNSERFVSMKNIIEQASDRDLHFGSDSLGYDEFFDSAIVKELSSYYDDITGNSFITSHIPSSKIVIPSIGFSSLAKWAHIIFWNSSPIGKVVITIKRNQSVKIGPIYISPAYRQHNYASRVLCELTSSLFKFEECFMVFATVAEHNIAGRKAFEKAGYQENHRLKFHYSNHGDEIVYTYTGRKPKDFIGNSFKTYVENKDFSKHDTLDNAYQYIANWTSLYFFPIDDDWITWLKNDFNFSKQYYKKSHEIIYLRSRRCAVTALLIPKRGGTLKVVLAHSAAKKSDVLEMLDSLKARAQTLHSRKVAIFLPFSTTNSEIVDALDAFGIKLEAEISSHQYSLYDSVKIFGSLLESTQ